MNENPVVYCGAFGEIEGDFYPEHTEAGRIVHVVVYITGSVTVGFSGYVNGQGYNLTTDIDGKALSTIASGVYRLPAMDRLHFSTASVGGTCRIDVTE